MKLTVTTFQTLDGVMQSPGAPEEDPRDFEHGGWAFPHFDAETGAFMDETFRAAEAFLLGRFTYETFAAYWPKVDAPDDPVATKLNTLEKHVVSRTLREEDVTWAGSSLLGDDVPGRVRELKARPGGELQVHGSAGLVQTLLREELIDELRLLTFPVVVGSGRRLFADGAVPAAMRLSESRTTSSGIVIAVYAFDGRPSYGTFALDEEGAHASKS